MCIYNVRMCVYVCACICMYVYIYIYIYTGRATKRGHGCFRQHRNHNNTNNANNTNTTNIMVNTNKHTNNN